MVQFSVGGRVLGSAPLSGGVAQISTASIPVGPHVVTVTYVGDNNYLPSTYQPLKQVVNP
jgi:hypothetical protein